MAYTSRYANGAAVDAALDKAEAALPATGTAADSDKLGGVAASGYAKEINGQAAFTDIADTDYVPMYDTSATVQKKTLWSNIKSVLNTYFATLFAPKISVITDSNTTYTISTAADKTDYRLGTLTELTVSAVPSGFFFCRICCTAGTGMTISLPSGYRKAGGAEFSYNDGDKIQIYIDQDGVTLVPFRA